MKLTTVNTLTMKQVADLCTRSGKLYADCLRVMRSPRPERMRATLARLVHEVNRQK